MIQQQAPIKAPITSGKFQNVDLRVARVKSAPPAEGTQSPCRVLTLDLGHLGERVSVGQLALLEEGELIGKKLIVCANLAPRPMGPYVSEVLVLGSPHPASPEGQSQALPIFAGDESTPGDSIY